MHRHGGRLVSKVLLWGSVFALAGSGSLLGSGLGSSQLATDLSSSSVPVTQSCSYGTSGALASDICWFSFGNYSVTVPSENSDLVASSDAATSTQAFPYLPILYRENLPNGDYATFDLTYKSSEINTDPAVSAVSSPVSWAGAAFGREGYVGLSGNPILYSQTNLISSLPSSYGPGDWSFVLSNINVYYPNGNSVPDYTIVAADGETTNSGESVVFKTSGGAWEPVGNMLPAIGSSSLTFMKTCSGNSGYSSSSSGSALYSNLGIGTDTVTCAGGADGNVGALVLSSASSPSEITATDTLTAPEQRQGVAFGIETPAAQPLPPAPAPAPVASLSLTKTESPSSPNPITKAGQSVTYDFRVTNTGNTLLNDLVVSDTQSVPGEALNGPVSCPTTSVAAGASVTCTGGYTVTSTDIANAEVTDTAVAKATTPTGINVTSNTSAYTIVVSTPTTTTKTVTPTAKTTTKTVTPTAKTTTKTVTPTAKTTTKTVTPTTKASSTAPAPVKLVTGPPKPPASSTNALPLGLGIAGLGIAGLGYLVIERKCNTQHGSTDEVA